MPWHVLGHADYRARRRKVRRHRLPSDGADYRARRRQCVDYRARRRRQRDGAEYIATAQSATPPSPARRRRVHSDGAERNAACRRVTPRRAASQGLWRHRREVRRGGLRLRSVLVRAACVCWTRLARARSSWSERQHHPKAEWCWAVASVCKRRASVYKRRASVDPRSLSSPPLAERMQNIKFSTHTWSHEQLSPIGVFEGS